MHASVRPFQENNHAFRYGPVGGWGEGMDFADALHLAHGDPLERLKTFDQRFIKRAAGKRSCLVEEP